ncbi:MAG TPA: DUF3253 domain-containing protein [Luteimonas sp.]|nr:DUF3253 domain-containing protein [Luteimonas sp.]
MVGGELKPALPHCGMPDAADIEAMIRRLMAARSATSSLCPSEVARALEPAPAWRALMPAVRAVARALAVRGVLTVTQRGVACNPASPWRGPVRLRQGPSFTAWVAGSKDGS